SWHFPLGDHAGLGGRRVRFADCGKCRQRGRAARQPPRRFSRHGPSLLGLRHDPVDTALLGQDVDLSGGILPEAGNVAPRAERLPVPLVGRLPADEAKAPDPALAVVAVEVDALERGDGRAAVHVASGDGAPLRVIIVENGQRETGPIAGLAGGGRVTVGSLHPVPAEVEPAPVAGSGRAVHLLVRVLADISDVEVVGGAVEAEAPWIAESEAPDLAPGGRS